MNNNNGENYDILLTRFLKDVIINFKRFNYVINLFISLVAHALELTIIFMLKSDIWLVIVIKEY